MKRWEELSRTEIVLRCLAAVVLLVFVVLGIYAGLSVALFCSQRERDIEYLRAMDMDVTFAVFMRRRVVAALEPTIRMVQRLVPTAKLWRLTARA